MFFALIVFVILSISGCGASQGPSIKSALKIDVYGLVTVDYDMPSDQMIAAGNYDSHFNISASDIKNFTVTNSGKIEVLFQLVNFNDHPIESADVLTELDALGLRPATLQEMLAFGAKLPEIQRQFPIIALGSVYKQASSGYSYVPCLDGDTDRRVLHMEKYLNVWYIYYRFLAVPK